MKNSENRSETSCTATISLSFTAGIGPTGGNCDPCGTETAENRGTSGAGTSVSTIWGGKNYSKHSYQMKLPRGVLEEGNRLQTLLQFHFFSLQFRGFQQILAVQIAHLFRILPAGIRPKTRGRGRAGGSVRGPRAWKNRGEG